MIPILAQQPKKTGYRRGRLIIPTTESGWATYNAGSRLFLPAVTNQFKNPRLIEDGATGFPRGTLAYQSTVTGPIVSDVLPNGDGTFYHELTYTIVEGDAPVGGNFGVLIHEFGAFSPADPATFALEYQLIVSNARSCETGTLWMYQQPAFDPYSYTVVPPVSAWTRAAGTIAAMPAGTTGIQNFILATILGTCVAGDTITLRWRYPGAVKSKVLEPHFDGATPDCYWFPGPADTTPSVRLASKLRLPIAGALTPAAGTIAARFAPLELNVSTNKLMLNSGGGFSLRAVTGNTIAIWLNSGAAYRQVSAAGLAYGVPATTVARWVAASTLDFSLNGVNAAQSAHAQTPVLLTTMDVFADGYGPSAYIGPVVLSPTRKSDAWTAAIQANGGAAFGNLNLLWNTFMEKNDMLIPLNSDGTARIKR